MHFYFQLQEATPENYGDICLDHFETISTIGGIAYCRSYEHSKQLIEAIIRYDRTQILQEAREQ